MSRRTRQECECEWREREGAHIGFILVAVARCNANPARCFSFGLLLVTSGANSVREKYLDIYVVTGSG